MALTSLIALVALAAMVATAPERRAEAAADQRPNIILITTDDMTVPDLRWMPHTRQLIRAAGVTVSRFISNHPICCPARAGILTGQHAQNNGVFHNSGPADWGGYGALLHKDEHIGRWLKDAGYNTAFIGKHLNLWEVTRHRQPGWTRFNPILDGIYHPFDITMWHNGNPRRYTGTHTSDLMGQLSVRAIRAFSRGDSPFFIWTSQVAPHTMFVNGRWVQPVPARRHRDLYMNVTPPSFSDPAYAEADVSDKPPYVQETTALSRKAIKLRHRARIQSLRSVDDQVRAAIDALRAAGELRNTYVFLTSDNGYLLNEHRLQQKNKPYEEAVRIPLVVRGPSLPAGQVRPELYSLVDLAPTFLDIAQLPPRPDVDGRSMLGTLRKGETGYQHYLIQAAVDEGWWWRGVKSEEFVYVQYYSSAGEVTFEELYDMRSDPHQLNNVAYEAAYTPTRQEYASRLGRLATCAGETCRTSTYEPGASGQ